MCPQIVLLVLLFLNIGVVLGQHGKPRTGNHNVFVALISASITSSVLYWGGFFDNLLGN